MDERTRNTFRSLAQSGEGAVVYKYIKSLRASLLARVVDNPDSKTVDLKAARMARKELQNLADLFIEKNTAGADITDFD